MIYPFLPSTHNITPTSESCDEKISYNNQKERTRR